MASLSTSNHQSSFYQNNRHLLSFLVAIILHLLYFIAPYLLKLIQLLLLATLGFNLLPQPKIKILKKKPKEMQFMVIEDSPSEKVKDANKVSMVSQNAKGKITPKLKKSNVPPAISKAKYAPSKIGKQLSIIRPALNVKPQKQTTSKNENTKKPEKEIEKIAKAIRIKKEKMPTLNKQEQKINKNAIEKVRESVIDDKIVQISPPKKAISKFKQKKPTKKKRKYVFQKIGGKKSPQGGAPEKSQETSAMVEGIMAYRTLSIRYPKYIKEVFRKVRENFQIIASMSLSSYKTGEVAVAFGIAEDGTISYTKTVVLEKGMISEKLMLEKAIKGAAPFPPFTEAMKKDKAIFQRLGFRVYFSPR